MNKHAIQGLSIDIDPLKRQLRALASQYETTAFLDSDPSWLMHQVEGRENQEVMAFLASVLSYGRRDLFFPKLKLLLQESGGEPFIWLRERQYRTIFADERRSFYRLYNNGMMLRLCDVLREMTILYGSIGDFAMAYVRNHTALSVLEAFGDFFLDRGIKGMVPAPHTSVAKRPCMFLRWMARDASPVDLGLWSGFIDKRTLFIPLDTHVMQQARRLGLITAKTANWHVVEQLTGTLKQIFPDDPAKGDFALFGLGVASAP
ncbi:TIGR02757 family protein [Hallella multisaccharivorax]|uniref:TIGR02757 family protein n=1 Tax=Hallella multisaccharivorax TaxID=310514 RepID=UPI0036212A4B